MKMILGKKVGMTNLYSKDGEFVPVTAIESGDNFVVQIKTEEKDGYNALQIGFENAKKVRKPQENHFKKAKSPNLRNLREVRMLKEDVSMHKVGEKIDVNIFKEGEVVDVMGISKGKGFAGVIKRHNFSRGPMSHGSDHHREPGSIGSAFPQRVLKGTKLPGRMGHDQVTLKNLKIEKIDSENNIIFIQGGVPGPNKSLVMIKGEGVMYHEPEKHDLTTEKASREHKEEEKKEHSEEIHNTGDQVKDQSENQGKKEEKSKEDKGSKE